MEAILGIATLAFIVFMCWAILAGLNKVTNTRTYARGGKTVIAGPEDWDKLVDSSKKLFGGKSFQEKLESDKLFMNYYNRLNEIDYYFGDDPWIETAAVKNLLSERVDEMRQEGKLSASEHKRGKKLVANLTPSP